MSKINETNYPRRTQANYADTDMLVIQAAGGNTYTTRLEDMREDYEETLAPTLSALQDDVNENLATIEAGSTASQAYAKGDFLVFGGRLCKAKTSIAVNATLVLDTNIELASVGGELSSISSDLASIGDLEVLHSDASGGAITLSKAYTNYKFLILKFMTNSEVKYQLIPTSDITAGRLIMENVYGSSTSGLITKDQMFQYLAMCEVQFTDTTHATQVLQYINANWVLKCAAIWGVK